LLEQLFRLCF